MSLVIPNTLGSRTASIQLSDLDDNFDYVLDVLNGSIAGANLNNATAPTQAVGNSSTLLATTAFVANSIPSGVIVMWSGSVATVPSGWILCNGSNGTPDLRNRFVVGAGSTYAAAATGGSADAVVVSHTHTATVTDPGHFHTTTIFNINDFNQGGLTPGLEQFPDDQQGTANINTNSKATGITVANSTTGVSATNANLPPYYALAYIMKV